MKKPVVLRIYKADQLQGVKQFVDPQIVIGRPGEVQVALDGDSVSVLHASIDERGEGIYGVMDLGSESGTFLNGTRVLDSAIDSGDVLKIGDYTIEFYIGVPKPKALGEVSGVGITPIAPAAPVAQAAPPAPPVQAAPSTPAPTPLPPPPPVAPLPPPPVQVAPPVVAAAPPVQPVAPTKPNPVSPVIPLAPKAPEVKAEALKPEASKPVSKPVEKAAEPKATILPPPVVPSTISPNPVAATIGEMGAGMSAMTPMATPGSSRPRTTHARPNQSKFSKKKHSRFGPTFADPSRHGDVRDFVKPSKGTVVEVLVAWGERVISTQHFSTAKTITMGSHPDNDIILPLLASNVRKQPIVKIDRQAIVYIGADAQGSLVRGDQTTSFADLKSQNRLVGAAGGFTLALEQAELVQVNLSENVSVLVRYVNDTPAPLMAPMFDMSAAEFTGVILTLAMVATLYLYTQLYTPPKALGDDQNNEPQLVAKLMERPTPPPPLPPVEKPPEPVATPPPPVATPPPTKVKAVEKPTEQKVAVKKAQTAPTKAEGKSAEAAPNKNKNAPKTLTSVKQGGAIKTANKEASQMQSKSKDMSKAGVFSAFGAGGAQDKLAGSTTGAGALAGAAANANGLAGSASNRAGEGLGSEIKDTGAGGHGKSLNGMVGGVGTEGRGSGKTGYGTGGLGAHTGMKVVTGGTEESIGVGIDKEAIRRVIMANLRIIRSCYEAQLNRHPELYGKLVLSWDIGEQGRVVAARVKSNDLGSQEVANCITEKLKTWKFPEPPPNQVVVVEAYPFFFSN